MDERSGLGNAGDFVRDLDFFAVMDKYGSEEADKESDVSSIEIPQADSLSVLRFVLEAIYEQNRTSTEISDFLEQKTEEDWTERQAYYYALAAHSLGFVIEDQIGDENEGQKKWRLRKRGKEYIQYHLSDDEKARRYLYSHIREVDIINKVLTELRSQGQLDRSSISEIVREESEISGSTADRRAITIGKWISALPNVKKVSSNPIVYDCEQTEIGDF